MEYTFHWVINNRKGLLPIANAKCEERALQPRQETTMEDDDDDDDIRRQSPVGALTKTCFICSLLQLYTNCMWRCQNTARRPYLYVVRTLGRKIISGTREQPLRIHRHSFNFIWYTRYTRSLKRRERSHTRTWIRIIMRITTSIE